MIVINEAAQADAPGLSGRVLRHMAVEVSALLEEVQVAAAGQVVRGSDAAPEAVETVSGLCYRLTQISSWLAERIAWSGSPSEAQRDFCGLGPRRPCRAPKGDRALESLTERADRLFDRAARLDALMTGAAEPEPRPRVVAVGGPVGDAQARVLRMFDRAAE